MKESQQQEIIKRYLLGDLLDQPAADEIERRLMTDDIFAEEVSIYEDELIDHYIRKRLNSTERAKFENHFLLSPEMKERVQFAQIFKDHLDEQKTTIEEQQKVKSYFNWLPEILRSPAPAMLVILLVCGSGLFIWYFLSRQPELNTGIASFQQVYGKKRPFESRITGFDYSPLNQTRGGDENQIDILSRDRAERNLLEAAATNKTSSSLYWLGKFYLAEKNFDKAINYFEQASRLDPADAKLQADLGAALLEAGKKAKEEKDSAKSYELLNSSLKHLERAIELDPKLLEPRFNRALSQEAIPLPEQAKQAWGEYLELDSSSNWADEARHRLKQLESQKPPNLSAAEIEKAFLTAFRQKNDTEAGTLISQNREIIKQKYLPQKLAMSFIEAPHPEKKEYLDALIYAGELEKKNIGDQFASDLAAFYAKVSEPNLEVIQQAQDSIRFGCQLLLEGKFSNALTEFNNARELFLKVKDIWEAKLSEFFIVYCLNNTDQIKSSLGLAEELAEFCQQRKYKWLLSNILYWFAAAQRITGQREKANITYKLCFQVAEEIKDPQILEKILMSLAKQSNFVGRHKAALSYLQRIFENAENSRSSLRQKWQNYSDGVEMLANGRLYNLGKSVSLENSYLVKELNDPLYQIYSEIDAGIIHSRAKDFVTAKNWLTEAKRKAENVSEEVERRSLSAKISLELGHIERELNDNLRATEFYNEALSFVQNAETPYYFYEIKKSLLFAYLNLDNDTELEKQIPETVELTEKYRQEISEEQERNGFFNNEQNVYDIAVAYEFKHGRYEQAYDYLETSNSRSLLDWLQKGATVKEDRKNIEIIFNENTKPLNISEIRAQMPERVQILQYTVLENKILIWLISKDRFSVVSTEIDAEKLSETVRAYVKLLSANDPVKQTDAQELGDELYRWLITPIADQLNPQLDICLIPHKILFHLPFTALHAPGGNPFIADFNFFYAPSANVFLMCTKQALKKNKGDETLLSVGNPHFDRREFQDLQYLPEAEEEVREIVGFYSAPEPLIGSSATKSAFQKNLKEAEIIHFAGHYVVRHGSPLSSSMLFAQTGNEPEESVLTNAELIRQKLPRAKLVVLSACQTGVEQYYNGEGLIGLSRTFLAAGAPLVVASHWKVDSDATAELMKKFHFYRRQEKLSTTAALRRAQLEMINAPEGGFSSPYFWGAFAVFGGYAEF